MEVDSAIAFTDAFPHLRPVWARVRAKVCTAGLGWLRAAARKRTRPSAVRYLRPLASTRVEPDSSTGETIRFGWAKWAIP